LANPLNTIKKAGIVKTTRTVDLGDCDESYRGAEFRVWVTPTRAHWAAFADYVTWLNTEPERRRKQRDNIPGEAERAEFDRVTAEALDREMYERLDDWLAETWVNVEREDVTTIREHLQDDNPGAWDWLYNATLRTVREYRESLTKN